MKKLSIGILGTRGIPNHYGGFEQFAQYLSAGLVKRGHQVSVYNSSLHPYQEKTWEGVQLIHCTDAEHKLGTVGQFIYDLNCIQDARKRSFDVLLHLGYTSDSIWHRRWPRQMVHVVNMDGMEWMRSKYNKLTQKFLRKAESWAAHHADVLVADSVKIREHIRERYKKDAVFIPYGGEVFTQPDASVPATCGLEAGNYYMLMARMEPENNIEMIIKGYLASGQNIPLYIIGNATNQYGRKLSEKYIHPGIRFAGAIFDPVVLNNLRYFARSYFHGHSVGGTNPSLLEAMASSADIAAHDNVFNRAVLGAHARYFRDPEELAALMRQPLEPAQRTAFIAQNLEKIRNEYSQDKIIGAYESLMLQACAAPVQVSTSRLSIAG